MYIYLYGRGVGSCSRSLLKECLPCFFFFFLYEKKKRGVVVSGAVGDISVGKQQLTKCTPPIHLIYCPRVPFYISSIVREKRQQHSLRKTWEKKKKIEIKKR